MLSSTLLNVFRGILPKRAHYLYSLYHQRVVSSWPICEKDVDSHEECLRCGDISVRQIPRTPAACLTGYLLPGTSQWLRGSHSKRTPTPAYSKGSEFI
ncbi:hypothetical protein MRX96_036348 [Rhipicephalus microplus]